MSVKKFGLLLVVLVAALVLVFSVGSAQNGLTPTKSWVNFCISMKTSRNHPAKSCASCHTARVCGFVDPDKGLPVSEGVIPGLFGSRNSPASAYAMYAPIRYY